MFITVITDCVSENDKARQATRYTSLFGVTPTIVGVSSDLGTNATLEVAGNLVDALDAADEAKGIVVVNVAPRGNKKDGVNGTHFVYFHYKNILVISTIKGYCLSLVNKLGLIKEVNVLNTKEVLEFAKEEKLIDKRLKDYIANSQFRSFDFIPRVAKWLFDGIDIPSSPYPLSTIPHLPSSIWLIDSFGNVKTTILTKEVNHTSSRSRGVRKQIKTNIGEFNYYNRLKDLPFGETAFYTGSSGIGNSRFLEIATQGKAGSASKLLNLTVGVKINLL